LTARYRSRTTCGIDVTSSWQATPNPTPARHRIWPRQRQGSLDGRQARHRPSKRDGHLGRHRGRSPKRERWRARARRPRRRILALATDRRRRGHRPAGLRGRGRPRPSHRERSAGSVQVLRVSDGHAGAPVDLPGPAFLTTAGADGGVLVAAARAPGGKPGALVDVGSGRVRWTATLPLLPDHGLVALPDGRAIGQVASPTYVCAPGTRRAICRSPRPTRRLDRSSDA